MKKIILATLIVMTFTVNLWGYGGGTHDILMVVNDTTSVGQDSVLVNRMQDFLGYDVDLLQDDAVDTFSSYSDYDGIFISSSISPGTGVAALKDTAVPVYCQARYSYSALAMGTGQTGEGDADTYFLNSGDIDYICDVFSADTVKYSHAYDNRYFYYYTGLPNNAKRPFKSTNHADEDTAAMMCIDAGDSLTDRLAPARRVFDGILRPSEWKQHIGVNSYTEAFAHRYFDRLMTWCIGDTTNDSVMSYFTFWGNQELQSCWCEIGANEHYIFNESFRFGSDNYGNDTLYNIVSFVKINRPDLATPDGYDCDSVVFVYPIRGLMFEEGSDTVPDFRLEMFEIIRDTMWRCPVGNQGGDPGDSPWVNRTWLIYDSVQWDATNLAGGSDYNSTALDTFRFDYPADSIGDTIAFTISGSLFETWSADTSTNNGVVVKLMEFYEDSTFVEVSAAGYWDVSDAAIPTVNAYFSESSGGMMDMSLDTNNLLSTSFDVKGSATLVDSAMKYYALFVSDVRGSISDTSLLRDSILADSVAPVTNDTATMSATGLDPSTKYYFRVKSEDSVTYLVSDIDSITTYTHVGITADTANSTATSFEVSLEMEYIDSGVQHAYLYVSSTRDSIATLENDVKRDSTTDFSAFGDDTTTLTFLLGDEATKFYWKAVAADSCGADTTAIDSITLGNFTHSHAIFDTTTSSIAIEYDPGNYQNLDSILFIVDVARTLDSDPDTTWITSPTDPDSVQPIYLTPSTEYFFQFTLYDAPADDTNGLDSVTIEATGDCDNCWKIDSLYAWSQVWDPIIRGLADSSDLKSWLADWYTDSLLTYMSATGKGGLIHFQVGANANSIDSAIADLQRIKDTLPNLSHFNSVIDPVTARPSDSSGRTLAGEYDRLYYSNIIANWSFEQGDLNHWTEIGTPSRGGLVSSNVFSGNWAYEMNIPELTTDSIGIYSDDLLVDSGRYVYGCRVMNHVHAEEFWLIVMDTAIATGYDTLSATTTGSGIKSDTTVLDAGRYKLVIKGYGAAPGDALDVTFDDVFMYKMQTQASLDTTSLKTMVGRVVNDSSLARAITATDYQGGSSGPGDNNTYVYVLRSSDSTAISKARVTATLEGGASYTKPTDGAGEAIFQMTTGDSIFLKAAGSSPYSLVKNDTIVIVEGSNYDTLYMTSPTITDPDSAGVCRVFGYIYDVGGTARPGVSIKATLQGAEDSLTFGATIYSTAFPKTTTTDDSGKFHLDLKPNVLIDSNSSYKIEFVGPYISGSYTVTVPDTTSILMSDIIRSRSRGEY